jgi:glycosyltransferase involved in cell wall biosynthesis
MNAVPNNSIRISVIVPCHNSRKTLPKTLASLAGQSCQPHEIIVVNDRSTDETATIASNAGCTVANTQKPGVSSARNLGGKHASGNILLFIDDDVVLDANALRILTDEFADQSLSGVVGLLSPHTPATTFGGKYKNAYMHFSYLNMPNETTVFYTSIAAIRTDVFLKTGGFDENYISPNIEDYEFGKKLKMNGFRLKSCQDLQVVHHKDYTIKNLLKTAYLRSSGIVRVILRHRGQKLKTNNSPEKPASSQGGQFSNTSFLASIPYIFVCIALSLAFFLTNNTIPGMFFLIALWAGTALVNRSFLSFLRNLYGPSFAYASSVLIVPDIFFHGLGIMWGFYGYFILQKRY